MKRWLVPLVIGALLLTYLSTFRNSMFATFGVRLWETRSYEVLKSDGPFELRRYQPATIATTTIKGDLSAAGSRGHARLGGYIFGENETNTVMAMTTPVEFVPNSEREGADPEWQVSFYMPRKWVERTLPTASRQGIQFEQLPVEKVASFRYSGSFDDKDWTKRESELRSWISKQDLEPIGPLRIAGFDPPWTPRFLRRNEVHIPVRERSFKD